MQIITNAIAIDKYHCHREIRLMSSTKLLLCRLVLLRLNYVKTSYSNKLFKSLTNHQFLPHTSQQPIRISLSFSVRLYFFVACHHHSVQLILLGSGIWVALCIAKSWAWRIEVGKSEVWDEVDI